MNGPIDDEDTVHLLVEVLTGRSPITGTVLGHKEARLDFCGWTALASAIDRALSEGASKDKGE